ncbi:MAG: beta-galactosidase [Gammaproteobacteria bacterium]|nr:beta-galactosidase [Gammaproteobacteria bacterium]
MPRDTASVTENPASPTGTSSAYRPATGVCYYPEHWPESRWAQDAEAMVAAGIAWVRIAEFAWSRLEPVAGHFEWQWLDRAIDTLAGAGLNIVLCTPTATPPKWMVDNMPDMLAVDAEGRRRGFGSRRHYSFSHTGYRAQSRRITTALAERYGQHPAIKAWQTDNEYGCHDTVLSYCQAARTGFQQWLRERYEDIEALNRAWGTLFWSQALRSFECVELPNLTVTEANPAQALDFRRYSSAQIAAFNRAQVEILRRLSPGRPIAHNFMGRFNGFDHRAVAVDLDIAAWDSYPIGFLQDLQCVREEPELVQDCLRSGDPDLQAFHHDLYRGMGALWIMEQQPGPVNWAAYNPIPAPGAVRLWSFEAIAHGAEVVSYFRWRQAPFAQEQMHAGLLDHRADPAPGLAEVEQVNAELARLNLRLPKRERAPIALIHDYASNWMSELDGQSVDYHALRLELDWYRALRELGASIDVIGVNADLDDYRLVLAPGLMHIPEDLGQQLMTCQADVILGPRSGVKTAQFQLPQEAAPAPVAAAFGVRIKREDALPRRMAVPARFGACESTVRVWRDELRLDENTEVLASCSDGWPIYTRRQWDGRSRCYICAWPDARLLKAMLGAAMRCAGLPVRRMPGYLRLREYGGYRFITNYGPETEQIPAAVDGERLLGERTVPPRGVAILRSPGV